MGRKRKEDIQAVVSLADQEDRLQANLDALDEIFSPEPPPAEESGGDFAWALSKLYSGESVVRKSWFNQTRYISVYGKLRNKMLVQYSPLHKSLNPWHPASEDIFANDWIKA